MTMRSRALTLIVLTGCCAALPACGGSEKETDEIVALIKRASTSTDPADCTRLFTQRFLDQTEIPDGSAAVRSCRDDAADASGNPRSVAVSNVQVDGDTATARAAFEGGDLDGQAINLRVIKDGEQWKLDHLDSFSSFDRGRFLRAAERSFTRPPNTLPRQTARCMVRRFDTLSDRGLQDLFLDADAARLASLLGPCFVGTLRRELAKQPIPRRVADCVIGQIGKPPYDAIRRIFTGASAEAVFMDAVRVCLETDSV
jgi:hypothetical protein